MRLFESRSNSIIRFLISLIFLCFTSESGITQVESISGFPNAYAKVLTINYCEAYLMVTDTTGFQPGKQILLIQMQGAEIDRSNSADYGDITQFNGAGLHEKATISSVSKDTIFLVHMLLNSYETAGSVQIVSFPKYENIRITGGILGKNWDGETGGIVALEAENYLYVQSGINVSGQGFRGGKLQSLSNPCLGALNNASRQAYPGDDWHGAPKGEGISKIVFDYQNGKGPEANGGGGGNDHNSGGAGGAHIASAGDGGKRDTPFFTGDCKGENPGRGGKGLGVQSADKIFLGGGGGAGHSNNNVGTAGNNGGGIILLIAKKIIAENATPIFSAWGSSASNTNGGDGAGGGGAGGCIILQTDSIEGNFKIDLFGGDGGDADNRNSDDCFGPGGGGSGGRFLINQDLRIHFNLNLSGGQPGQTINSTRGCNNSRNGAQAGEAGLIETYMPLKAGTTLPGPPIIAHFSNTTLNLCEFTDHLITANASGDNLQYQWQIDAGNGFENLVNNNVFNGSQAASLSIRNIPFNLDGAYLRVEVINACGAVSLSEEIQIFIDPSPISEFTYSQVGSTFQFSNLSLNASSYLWNFGDGNTTSTNNPNHQYADDGSYTVSLTASNGCGDSTFTLMVDYRTAPMADFSANQTVGCAPLTIAFQNQSSTNAAGYQWHFPGGIPTTSSDKNPIVTYGTRGTYEVRLIVENTIGRDTLERIQFVEVFDLPDAGFSFNTNNLSVDFQNQSNYANQYSWIFGDGNSSTEINPNHSYSSEDLFTVILQATNQCGTVSDTQLIQTGLPPLAAFNQENNKGCRPLTIQYFDVSTGNVSSRIWTFEGGTPNTSADKNPIVVYQDAGTFDVSLEVSNSAGTNSFTSPNHISVYERPLAGFDYQTNGKTVNFNNTSINASLYVWDFGDGSPPSTATNPQHTYNAYGQYLASLNASNEYCGSSITYGIQLETSNSSDVTNEQVLSVYPNPASNFVHLDLLGLKEENFSVELYNLHGKKVMDTKLSVDQDCVLDVKSLPSGLYILKIKNQNNQLSARVIKI